jgi:hypothetical protein
MVVREFYEQRFDGVNLYRTYSDAKKIIHKIGTDEYYEEAVDVENSTFEYEETEDNIIEDHPNEQ